MKVAVIGGGGHSKVVLDLIAAREDMQVKAILDDKYKELILENDIYKGPISSAHSLIETMGSLQFVVAIGNNKTRKAIVTRLGLRNEHYITLIHQRAVVSSSAVLDHGTIVMANAVVNADVHIGAHSIINTGAIVEHDSTLEEYVHISPSATLTGSVSVGEGAFIGAGAAVIPGKHIGAWAVIGAGSTAISDIPPYCTAVGSPAKTIKYHIDKGEGEEVHAKQKPQKNLSFKSPYERKRAKIY